MWDDKLTMGLKIPNGIKKEDALFVRAAIGEFVSRCEETTLGYHNFLGNNKHGLMHVFGCTPLMYAAVMLTAGVFRFWGKEDSRKIIVKEAEWSSIMNEKEIARTGQFSTYGRARTPIVSIGTINPRVADSAIENRFKWDDMLTAKLQFSEPPIPPPRRAIVKHREAFKNAISPHVLGGYELISFEINSKALEDGKVFAREIGSDEPCACDNDDDDTVETAATGGLEDDSDDEDFDPAEDGDDGCLLDDDIERNFMLYFEREDDDDDGETAAAGATASNEPVKFPLLGRLGINPNNEDDGDRDTMERLMGEIWRANSLSRNKQGKKKPTSIEFRHHISGKRGQLFLVPQVDYGIDVVAANKRLQKKTKDTGAFDELVLHVAKGKKEHTRDAARSMCEYFWRRYKNEQYEAAKEKDQVLLKERFDTIKTAALFEDMHINLPQMRILQRYLRDHFGYPVLASEPEVYSLGLGYVEPEWGNYEYTQPNKLVEDCPYWIRNIKDVILKVTERRFKGSPRLWEKIVRIGVVVGGDHGQGAFRIVIKIGYFFDKETKKKPILETIKVAHVDCKKESDEILGDSVLKKVGEHLSSIDKFGLLYKASSDSFKWVEKASNQNQPYRSITQFATGDISFLFMILGRVGASFWCLVCDCHKDTYQCAGHEAGTKWNVQRLKDLAARHSNGEFRGKESDALSVRKEPFWPSIDVGEDRVGLARLHRELGEANDVVGPEGYLMRKIENDIVQYSDKEKEARLELSNISGVISAAKLEKSNWENATRAQRVGRERDQRNKLHELRALEIINIPTEAQSGRIETLKKDLEDLSKAIRLDKADEKDHNENIKKCDDKKKRLKAKVAAFNRKRKTDDDGVYHKMEKILRRKNIHRGAYHGGAFQGPHLRIYMEKAEEIFQEYLPILKAANWPVGSPDRKMSDEEIESMCKNCVDLLHIIDSINKILLTWYFDVDADETQKALKELKDLNRRALEMVREMGMSVTPKWTLQEDHSYNHHKKLIEEEWGGEVFLDESFVEHEHQTGVKEDRRTQAMATFREKQSAQMKTSHRSSNPAVQSASLERNREKRKRTGAQTSTRKEVKQQYREEASKKAAPPEEDEQEDEQEGSP